MTSVQKATEAIRNVVDRPTNWRMTTYTGVAQVALDAVEFEAMVEVLSLLVECKRVKDEHGKTEWYRVNQPVAWERARDLLSRYGR